MYEEQILDNKNLKEKKPRRFKLFDYTKDGKGISKSAAQLPPGLKRFFVTYKENFNKLVLVNILMVLVNIPAIFLIINIAGYFKQEYFLPMSDLFQNLGGLFAADGEMTPFKMSLLALEGRQYHMLADTVVNYIFYGIGALFLFTFGIVNVGTAYILRNMVSGEPIFVWHDFWYAIKRNYKQAIPFGIFDVLINALLIYNIFSLVSGTAQFFASMLFWSNVVIFIMFFFMRYYVYVQMVTFKLSIFKILKNSLRFAIIGFKRNIVALLGIILAIVIELMLLLGTGGLLVPFAVAAPLAMLFATMAYMKVYASYFKIKALMIDPYYEEHPEELKTHSDSDEPIMRDDVTEKERIEEIKRRNNIL